MIRPSEQNKEPKPLRPPGPTEDGMRRKDQHLLNAGLLYSPQELAKACSLAPGQLVEAEAAWSRRYTDAAKRYEALDLCSQEAVIAVVEGLQGWARLVPQRSVGASGVPEEANKWGLGPERCVLRALHSHLVAIGQPVLAARIRSEMADLLQTAEALDACCRLFPPDPHAENRLVATARIQTKALVKLLSTIRLGCMPSVDTCPAPRSRRGAPCRVDPVKDQRLMEEWAQVRGKAGMTRKEFCAARGITFQAFTQAQDRFRKRTAPRARAA